MWFLSAAALAQAPTSPSPPGLILECRPIGALAGALSAAMGKLSGGTVGPEQLASWGLDLDGAVRLEGITELEGAYLDVRLDFTGTPGQAEQLLQRMGPEAVPTEEGWVLEGGAEVQQLPGELRMRMDANVSEWSVPDISAEPALEAISRPASAHCALAAAIPEEASKAGVAGTLSVLLPLAGDGTPLSLRLQTEQAPPAAMRSSLVPPLGASTKRRPTAVVALGVPIDDILLDPAVVRFADLTTQEEAELRQLLKRVRVAGGSTFALFLDQEQGPEVAARIGIRRADGRPLPPARSRRLLGRWLEGDGYNVTKTSRFSADVFSAEGQPVFSYAFRRGEMLFASTPVLLEDVVADDGTPWVTDALERSAQTNFLAIANEGGAIVQGGPPISLEAGIRADEAAWTVSVHLRPGPGVEPAAVRGFVQAAIAGAVMSRMLMRGLPEADIVVPEPEP